MKRETVQWSFDQIIKNLSKIDLNPPYQRVGGLWNKNKKIYFIDSLINNFDIPKIYLHYGYGNDGTNYHVIDGKQRLETLLEFRDDKIILDESVNYILENNEEICLNELTYTEIYNIYPHIGKVIDNYIFDVVIVYDEDIQNIEEMFRRLNNGAPLNNAEIRYAYSTDLNTQIKNIAITHPFFTNKVKFSNNRKYHYDTMVRICYIEQNINKLFPIYDYKLTEYVKNGSLSPDLLNNIQSILDFFALVFEDKDTLLTSRNTLLIYYIFIRKTFDLGHIAPNVLKRFFADFSELILENRQKSFDDKNQVLAEYDLKSQQGTSSVGSIELRLTILQKCWEVYQLNNQHINHADINLSMFDSEIRDDIEENSEFI